MPRADDPSLGPLLILAPIGRDSSEIARVLAGIGTETRVVPSLAALADALRPDCGAGVAAALIAEEALAPGAAPLASCLAGQPPWSDLPVLVLTAGGQRRGTAARWAVFEALGNVTLLGRPLHAETLQSAVRGALRARARQHETKRHLEALRLATETLEARVEQRTRELMAVEETLRHAQKMEAVGQLTGGIAHDFNNLLTGVTGSLELLQRRVAQGRLKDVERLVVAAQGAAGRAAALTHRLLAFSRRQTLDPRPTQVNRLVASMEELIRRTVGPAIAVEAMLAADIAPTLCDPNQLENALLNLCINARDAMPDGGRITIRTANATVTAPEARARDIAPGHYVTISVADTGTGMTPDVLARAFDPFFTTKPLGQGTGLGLSMIYGFARQSGGQVRISSEPGRGTRVEISLPRHDAAAAAEDAPVAPAGPLRATGRRKVLVVDDEAAVRTLAAEFLGEMGHDVVAAADGTAGLRMVEAHPDIDVMVTDVGLPGGMNGRQLADAARRTRPGLQVLFITGYAENAVVGDGHLEPGMHLLTKPFALQALADKIAAILAAASPAPA